MKLLLLVSVTLIAMTSCQLPPTEVQSACFAQTLVDSPGSPQAVAANCIRIELADTNAVCADSDCLRVIAPIYQECDYDYNRGGLLSPLDPCKSEQSAPPLLKLGWSLSLYQGQDPGMNIPMQCSIDHLHVLGCLG